jgi:Zn-dependent peptidase ImmA (M78 family)
MLRRQAGVGKADPVCVYDLLEERFGIEVKFQPIESMEGMLIIKEECPVIVLCSERPPGRQAYTCAHEFGHYVFGHGSKVDEYLAGEPGLGSYNDPDEWLADRFAGFFLMPKYAVERAFKTRGWDGSSCNPYQAYVIAGHLGVGYETIIQHMRWSLQMLTDEQAKRLLKKTPKQIRRSLLSEDTSSRLLVVDRFWDKVAVDLQVGDNAILPRGVLTENKVVRVVGDHDLGVLAEAEAPGTERAVVSGLSWAVNIRVSRKSYVGRGLFRHLEDPDHESPHSGQ